MLKRKIKAIKRFMKWWEGVEIFVKADKKDLSEMVIFEYLIEIRE